MLSSTLSPVACAPDALPTRQARWLEVVAHLDPKYGGLSSAVPDLGWNLQRGLVSDPLDISLAAFCAPGEQFRPAGFAPESVSYWPASRSAWLQDRLRGYGELYSRLLEEVRQADGIHIHGLWEGSTLLGAEAARTLRKPYLISAHGMLEPWALRKGRIKKLLYGALVERRNVARATCLHALTHAEAAQFVSFGARCPIAVVPNAVDCPTDKDPEPFLAQFPLLRGKRLLVFMARLHPKKGLSLLLEAWSTLAARFPDAHLVIAGPDSGGTEARVRRFVADRKLQDSVTLTGMLRGSVKWSVLAAAEAFVLPSFSEGLSVAVLEAMGIGLPVVITTACNMPAVGRADAGWVVEPELQPLRSALQQLLQNTSANNRAIGRAGESLVQLRYSWPVVARQMAAVYAWVLGGPVPDLDVVHPA